MTSTREHDLIDYLHREASRVSVSDTLDDVERGVTVVAFGPPHEQPRRALAFIGAAASIILVAGLVIARQDGTPEQAAGAATSPTTPAGVDSTGAPTTTSTTVPTTTAVTPASIASAVSDAQALADLREYADLRDWIGPYSIILREAAADLGTVDGVTYRVEITDTSFCIIRTSSTFGGGSGCVSDEDLSTFGAVEQSWTSGGGSNDPSGLWERYFIMPSNIDNVELMLDSTPACDLTPLPMDPIVEATLWACVSTGGPPDTFELRLEATQDGITRGAVVQPRPNISPESP